MPRQSRGPRLYLRKGRIDGRSGHRLPDLFYIRDGHVERGTGCGPDRLREAERALAAYLAEKGRPARRVAYSPSDPAEVPIADVVALYATERAPKLSDPESAGGRLKVLLAWWGDKHVADVTRSNCNAYVAHRIAQPRRAATTEKGRLRLVTPQGARRELEDLSAALSYWTDEHHLNPRPKVIMPERPPSPRDALTRAQAASLVKAARGFRKTADGAWERLPALTRARRAHMARFILVGCYTGTRPGAIKSLLWRESPLQAWVDLDKAMIYRRGRAERDTKKRRPVARMPQALAAHMRRWAKLDAARSARAAAAAQKAGKDAPPPIASVIHYAGAPVQSVRGSFAAIVADAGLSGEITPHWLRHTAATWLMESGADPWAASAYMGMTVETLERHYGHHRPDYQAAVTSSRRRTKTA